MNSGIKRFRGAVAVEFAIIVPLLVVLLFGITELGRALYQLNTLTKATTSGARYLARLHNAVEFDESNGTCSPDSSSDSEWTSANIEKAKNLVLYGTETKGDKTLIPNMSIEDEDISIENDPRSAVANEDKGCVISVTAHATFSSIFGGGVVIPAFIPGTSSISGPVVLSQTVQERYIGE